MTETTEDQINKIQLLAIKNRSLQMELDDLKAKPTIKDKQIRNLLKECARLDKQLKTAEKGDFEDVYRKLQKDYRSLIGHFEDLRVIHAEFKKELERPSGIIAFFTKFLTRRRHGNQNTIGEKPEGYSMGHTAKGEGQKNGPTGSRRSGVPIP